MTKRVFAAVLAACLVAPAAIPVRAALIHTRSASLLQLEFEVRRKAARVELRKIWVNRCNESATYGDPVCSVEVEYDYSAEPIPGDTASVLPDWIQTLDTIRVPVGVRVGQPVFLTRIDLRGPEGSTTIEANSIAIVHNWYPHMPLCGYSPCPPGDSASIRKDLALRLQRTGIAYRFVSKDSTLGFGPWQRATGNESHELLVARLPSNAGNWLRKRTADFVVEVLAGRNDKLPERISYPTGLVEYAYNSPAPPGEAPLSGRQASRWQNIAKIGDPALLKEQAVVLCHYGVGDSDVVKTSWLVIPDSLTESAVYAAFWDTTSTGAYRQAGCVRPGAWQMSHDTVFLWKNRFPVRLADLLQTAGILSRTGGASVRPWPPKDALGRSIDDARRGILIDRSSDGGSIRKVRLED